MIRLPRFFPRVTIQTKLILAFCLFGAVPVAVVGGYGAAHSFFLLDHAIQERLRAGVRLKTDEIQRFLGSMEGNVLFLSEIPTLLHLINLAPGQEEEAGALIARLGEEFLSFARSNPIYTQVRYLDEGGREIVRADFDGREYRLAPPLRLQNKKERYYFKEAMAKPAGSVYVSPLDLNIEAGRARFPAEPTVRYATPVRDRQGRAKGVVILNLDATRILQRILTLGRELGEVSLITSEGFYLTRSEGSRAQSAPPVSNWETFYAERPAPRRDFGGVGFDRLLERDFGVNASPAVPQQPGVAVGPGLSGRIVAFAPIFPQRDRQGEFWVLFHSYSKQETLASIRSLQILVLTLGGLVLLIAFGVGVIAARSLTRPITELMRGAEAVARGDFDHPLLIETRDEIEDLSRQFTAMSGHLKERERQVEEARDRAERKAREAQVLYRIGTEILAVLSLPRTLRLVVDKARELMQGDLAVLCLNEAEAGLRVGATSGPPQAFLRRRGDWVGEKECLRLDCANAPCPVVAEQGLSTHIVVPLKNGARAVGDLCIAYRSDHPVDAEALEFLKGLANLAVIAIENARLHRKEQQLAALEERERIAAELHDGIIQSIYGTGLGLMECARLAQSHPLEVKRRVERTIEELNTVIRDLRNYIVGLQAEGLQQAGLTRSLAGLIDGMARNTLPRAELKVAPGVDAALAPEQIGHLFQICREALTNVIKHAGAGSVALTLGAQNGRARLTVEDDGAGFDPAGRGRGHGLSNIEQRARRLGGTLRVETAPSRGTRLTVEFPLKAREAA